MDTYIPQVTNRQISQWHSLVKGISSSSVTSILVISKWAKLTN
jgi:hypothetical protein